MLKFLELVSKRRGRTGCGEMESGRSDGGGDGVEVCQKDKVFGIWNPSIRNHMRKDLI